MSPPHPCVRATGSVVSSILNSAVSLCPQQCLIQSKRSVSICSVDEFTTEPLIVAGGMLYSGCLWCWLYMLLTGLGVLWGTSSNMYFHTPQFDNEREVCSFWWLRTQSPGGWVYVWVRWSLTCLSSHPLGRALTLSGTRTPRASFFSRSFGHCAWIPIVVPLLKGHR